MINCVAIMGGMNVESVPPGVEVVVRGLGIMGGFDHSEEGVPGDPGAPRVIVTGFAFWGGVGVERKVTRAQRQRLKEERRQEKLERKAALRELHDSVRGARGGAPPQDAGGPPGHAARARDERREQRELRREDRDPAGGAELSGTGAAPPTGAVPYARDRRRTLERVEVENPAMRAYPLSLGCRWSPLS
ncbi:hypothetical protein SVIOM342S_06245 [Streptomyces violaceorubidus]